MTVVAIIPFRAGSKGVKNKNTRHVAGKPLWCWSLEAAQQSEVDRVVVTTDVPLSQIHRQLSDGDRLTLMRRPPGLAIDTASLDSALVHAIDYTALPDDAVLPDDTIVVILQPTCPVRRPGLIDACLRLFERFPAAKSLLTVNPLHYVWNGNSGQVVNPPRVNRQEMDSSQEMFHEDGSIFIVRAGDLRETGSRVVDPVVLFETERTVDIDTESDMELAGYLLTRRFT